MTENETHIPLGAPRPQAIVQLTDYLAERRGELIKQWMAVVHREPAIQASEIVTAPQLKNHLPQLCDALLDLLSHGGEQATQQARETAHLHGDIRWEQHYDLSELMRELALLREIFIGCLMDFEERTPEFSGLAKRFALTLIHRFFDDVSRRSAASFVAQEQTEIRKLSDSRLHLLRNVSHELRNAVNSISLISNSLREEPDANYCKDFGKMLGNAVRHMREMLDQLLDLSRFAEGDGTIKLESFALAELQGELAALYGPMCESNGLKFQSASDDTLTRVVSDPSKLRQIANNLLNNAVKFTSTGSVTLEMRDVDATQWSLIVKDTGMGIPAAAQENLFHEFYRAPGAENIHGTGLGLAITKRLVELLGGNIHVDSAPGKGSCFEVVFPKRFDGV